MNSDCYYNYYSCIIFLYLNQNIRCIHCSFSQVLSSA